MWRMSRITIETKDQEVLDLIKRLADKKRIKILEHTEIKMTDPVEIMNKIAVNSSLSSIKDPVAWQRELRKDRKLPFRE